MFDNGLETAQHIVRILHGTLADIVGFNHSAVHNGLCLCVSLLNNAVGLGVCPLHNLMLIHQLVRLRRCLGHHGIGLGTGFLKNGILIAYNLLILLNLFRYP